MKSKLAVAAVGNAVAMRHAARNGRPTGFKTAAAEEVPDAVAVMDPFHVIRLAGDALEPCRRPVQRAAQGHRGHKDGPLHAAHRHRAPHRQAD